MRNGRSGRSESLLDALCEIDSEAEEVCRHNRKSVMCCFPLYEGSMRIGEALIDAVKIRSSAQFQIVMAAWSIITADDLLHPLPDSLIRKVKEKPWAELNGVMIKEPSEGGSEPHRLEENHLSSPRSQ